MKHILPLLALLPLLSHAQHTWTLSECIDHALQHNISIKQQQDNVKLKEISLSTVRNSRLPNLSGSAGENFNFGRALTADNIYQNRNTQSTSFGLSTSVPIITGGQIYYNTKVNKLNLEAALVDLDKARENVSLSVTSAYLEAVYQHDLVLVAQQQIELSQAQVDRMQRLFDNGKASEAELAQIQSTLASDQLSLTNQQNSYVLAILTLSQLLELPTPEGMQLITPDTGNEAETTLPLPELIYNEALGIKPQIQAEQIRLRTAEKNISLAKTAYYPSIYLNAGISTNYYKTSGYFSESFGTQLKNNFGQYIGLSLSVPIFNRLQTRNSVRSARVQMHTQQLQLEETKKSLYKEIQQAYYNALGAQKQCTSSDAALQSARISFDLMEKKYENGKANATEYQQAKTQLLKAESTALQSRYSFLFRQKILNFYRGEPLK